MGILINIRHDPGPIYADRTTNYKDTEAIRLFSVSLCFRGEKTAIFQRLAYCVANDATGACCEHSNSAICTALSAAPFRSWSPATNMEMERPLGSLVSWRMRPTRILS